MKLFTSITEPIAGTTAKFRKSSIVAAIVITLIFGLWVSAPPVKAASVTWDGGGVNNSWSTPENWSGDTLPQSGDTITIEGSAGEVVLDIDFSLTGLLNIDGDGATLRINSGVTLTLLAPGPSETVTVDNGGTLINEGVIEGVSLSPLSRILVTSLSGYTGASTITNNNTLNTLEVFLRGSTTAAQYPTLYNNGTINTVRISTLAGAVSNSGTINDAQLSFQYGDINNEVGGQINTSFTLSSMGSRFINSTVFDNHGTVTNGAKIDNEGIFNNYGTFDNTGGTFTNTCDFNKGIIGVFNNYGIFLGNPVLNEGSIWDNDAGNGLWSDPVNWTNDVLPASTDDIIINVLGGADTTVTVDTDITIAGRLAIRNSLGAPISSTLIIQSGVTLTNNGSITPGSDATLNNQGSIINNGEIRAACSATFINTGSFTGNPVLGICIYWDGDAGNGLWSDPLNWSGDTLPQVGNKIVIDGDAGMVVLDTDFTVVCLLVIDGEGSMLWVDVGVTLTLDPILGPGQYDTVIVDNGGILLNSGVIEGTTLSPLARIFVTSLSGYTGESIMSNNDTLNQLEVYMRGSTTAARYPTLYNYGTMNTVRVSTLAGAVDNSGLIDDAHLSFQFGDVNNAVGGTINTSFTLSSMGSRFINSTVFDNHGTVNNGASINNEGIFNNHGTFDNTLGTFDNQGTFTSYCGSVLLGTISGNPVNEIPCNEAPETSDIPDQTVNEGGSFVTITLDNYVNDPDNDDDELTWTYSGNSELTVSIDVNRVATIAIPDADWNGTETITFRATDPGSLWDEDAATFTVNAVNDPPSFAPGSNQVVPEDSGAQSVPDWATMIASGPPDESWQEVDFIVSNNNNALFSVQPAITADGTLTYTPAPDSNGSATVTVQLHDNGGTANGGQDTSPPEDFTIEVVPVNDPPELTLTPPGPYTLDEGDTLTINLTGSDIDGDSLTFDSSGMPAGATLTDNGDNTGTFNWTTSEADDGSYSVTFEVSDIAGDSDSETINITVNEVNEPPVFSPIGDKVVKEGDTLAFTLSANDPDIPANALTFSSPNLPAGATLDPITGDFAWTPDYNAYENAFGGDGVYIVTFIVSDDGLPMLDDTTDVTINVDNEPFGATEDITAADGGTVTNEAGTAEVDIPAGALDEDTEISIEPHSEYTLQDVYGEIIGWQYSFSPSGITFNEPVTIILYYDPLVVLEPWLVDIYYYNEAMGLWEPMHATLDMPNHCFYIQVDHFSTFTMVGIPTQEKINDYIQGLPDDAFDKNAKQRRNALENKLATLLDSNTKNKDYSKGDIKSAINKLLNDIRPKMDGEGNDWIIDSSAQQDLCTMIDTLVNHLQTKL